ncbi:MAG: ABC transporter permease [Streptococcaceae bacterium]|jgi:ABC-2 type transport system permease protein|nr:ABC transporter permease [Streptococcaceae bacterium]
MNNKFWIIVKEVYRKNVKSWSFLIAILTPILTFAIFGLIGFFAAKSSDITEKQEVAIVSQIDNVNQTFKSVNKTDKNVSGINVDALSNHYRFFSSEKKAKAALKKEKIKAYVIVKEKDDKLSANIYSVDSNNQALVISITEIVQAIQTNINQEKLKLTSSELSTLHQKASVEEKKVSFEDSDKNNDTQEYSGIRTGISYTLEVVIFMFIMLFASSVTQEIASEKGTRIMEILLSSITAKTHFYGKIVGITLVIITQFLSYVVLFGAGFLWLKSTFGDIITKILQEIDFSKLFGDGFYLIIPITILSFGIYIIVAALCGSLVSKMEDVPKATQPIVYLAMIGYISCVTFGNGSSKDALIIKIMSFIPFTSTFAMPLRLAKGYANSLEAWISIAILIVAEIVILQFSAKMYQTNVLIYNDNGLLKSFKQGLQAMKRNKAVK